MKLQMEELVEFLQESLAKDFFYEDDFVIDQLQNSISELKRAKLDLPAAGKKLVHMQIQIFGAIHTLSIFKVLIHAVKNYANDCLLHYIVGVFSPKYFAA